MRTRVAWCSFPLGERPLLSFYYFRIVYGSQKDTTLNGYLACITITDASDAFFRRCLRLPEFPDLARWIFSGM